ncbi:MarR family winged helix-turn-helix transcriptional regulator [Nakamurella flava]|uniref:MarR family winged helix-turn-helix transcriptional regulator n=1 Tax=Nakamurella flava TaxID=2576308 RepID=UPI00197CA1EA|nr:MarR family winged helix-turn-helix transcriptional regulator [Nakamurella flava]
MTGSDDLPPSAPNVPTLLFIAYRHVENRVLAAVLAAGFQITLAQARIFQRIGPQGTRLTELAEQAQVTKQTASALVDQLQAAGYVERRPDPTDARARLVCISPAGADAWAVAEAELQRVHQEWVAHLGPRAWADLHRSLLALREITDPYA